MPVRRINVSSGRTLEDVAQYSRALRVGDTVLQAGTTAIDRAGHVRDCVCIAGSTALTAGGAVEGIGDMYRQARSTLETIFRAVAEAGGTPADIVYTKSFFTDLSKTADYTRAWLEAFGNVRPTSTTLGIPSLLRPEMMIEIEAEAIIGAAKIRRDGYTQQEREKPRGYARTVTVGDRIYMSGCTDLDAA